MVLVTIFLFSVVSVAKGRRIQVTLDADRPFVRKQVSDKATLECCYRNTGGDAVDYTWLVTTDTANGTHNLQMVNTADDRLTLEDAQTHTGSRCHKLSLRGLQFSDAGLYQCFLNNSAKSVGLMTHGTFLQVYKPVEKILNISENMKNKILTAQGILLLLCVLLPGAKLLCKSKEIHAMEKRKAMRKEENIYEGLRIEDFSSPYDQIHRSPAEVIYEDVYLHEGESHLENP